jgi:phosphoribosylformimino-5-aminoimidazole carboxamide ribotide isomerase
VIELIPAIDIIDGKCVRLYQGDYSQKTEYSSDPVTVARRFADAGIRRLHLVDLDGAKNGRIVNLKILEAIATAVPLNIDFGGGVRTTDAVRQALAAGASQVTAGSIAQKNKALVKEWIDTFGAERIILGADFRDDNIAISGWQEQTRVHYLDFIAAYHSLGLNQLIATDVNRDGAMIGPALANYQQIKQRFPGIYCIASGGIRNMADIAALNAASIDAVIFGRAFYEGHITLKELSDFIC